jgi:hypothetical protein
MTSSSAWVRLAAVLSVGLTACGCGAVEVPQVDRVALESDIAERLTEAGEPARSVTCLENLVGQLGRTVRCDVVISDTNSFQPVVTVTSVDGDAVGYELTPAVSQAQLEVAVRRLAQDAGERVAAVACASGLDGAVGAQARCDVDIDGTRQRRTVEVTDVTGMTMNFNLLSN